MHLHVFLLAATLLLATAAEEPKRQRKRLTGGNYVGNSPGTTYNFYVDVITRRLNVWNELEYVHEAGGALYDDQHIITVAHALSSSDTYRQVRCGDQYRNVSNTTIHPTFNAGSVYPRLPGDLAILTVDSPFTLDSLCQPASLPSGQINSHSVTVAGWAYVFWSNTVKFMHAQLSAVHAYQCFHNYWGLFFDGDTQFCAIDWTGNAALCYGDAGAPALVNNVLVGLGSWTDGLCQFPAVFTRISYYQNWINDTISLDCSDSGGTDAPDSSV